MADTSKRIYINNTLMPKVQKLDVSREPVWSKNTGRNAEATMVGTIIAHKWKLVITFVPLSDSDATLLDNALTSSPFFNVKYHCPKTNKQVERTMYAGSVTYPVYSYVSGLPRYVGVGVDLIEK